MFEVTRRREQRDWAAFGEVDELGDPRRRCFVSEFGSISLRELGEALGTVSVELPQLGGRRQILAPSIEVRVVLAEAAGPQAVNEDARTIASSRRIVRTFDTDAEQLCGRSRSSIISLSRARGDGFAVSSQCVLSTKVIECVGGRSSRLRCVHSWPASAGFSRFRCMSVMLAPVGRAAIRPLCTASRGMRSRWSRRRASRRRRAACSRLRSLRSRPLLTSPLSGLRSAGSCWCSQGRLFDRRAAVERPRSS